MELICEKYRESVPEAEALCRRPKEYCRFRSACIIHFLGRERGRAGSPAPAAGGPTAADPGESQDG